MPSRAWPLPLLCLCFPAFAPAAPLDVVNRLRHGGCDARVKLAPLASDARLQLTAGKLAQGQTLTAAADQANYPATQLSGIHLGGIDSDAQIQKILRANYCMQLLNRDWQQFGSVQQGQQLWMVLATPQALPINPTQSAQQVLSLVNQARAQARRCGAQSFAATTPLSLNAVLTQAAQGHANDMAARQVMSHTGGNGSTPAQRVSQQGYRWKLVGENVAAGAANAHEVVAGWLSSPGHCANNIMNPQFTEMGIAYALRPHDEYHIYWAQSFAAPRR